MKRALFLAAGLLAGCGSSDSTSSEPAAEPAGSAPGKLVEAEAPAKPEAPAGVDAKYTALFAQLPDQAPSKDHPWSQEKADLGRMLYFDKRLSKDGTVSCNSCHQLDKFGVDGEPTSPGVGGGRGDRNSPTVYNAALHVAQFWDGREPDVEAQAKGPILNPIEMAMPDADAVVALLKGIPGYVDAFGKAFPGEEITYDHVGEAIGAFERKLVTPGKFDQFLAGDASALSADQKAGLDAFMDTGCMACHSGALLGGTMYQKLGAVVPWETADEGRKKVTGNDADAYMFKVPSLRNVAKTGPYLHDGSVADLGEMVKLMAKHQLGKELDDAKTAQIVAFLEVLTGEPDAAYIAEPELPTAG